MEEYLSDKLINSIQSEIKITLSLEERARVQKVIRGYFIQVHNEAVESTVMATNKRKYIKPNFYDK